ncbi:MAG: hypothetical protein ACXVHT_10950, partial [Methanobacterium sp.]
ASMTSSPIDAVATAAAVTATTIIASCVTGKWVYEKDDHCEYKNCASNFFHIPPPCMILQMCSQSLYSPFQGVSLMNISKK